jgi:hypothetical protein
MKLFNNISELWNYCVYCPICEKSCKRLDIKIGPEQDFAELLLIEKNDEHLIMGGFYKYKDINNRKNFSIKFNLLDNTFAFHNILSNEFKLSPYIYMQSFCYECSGSDTITDDIILDLKTNKLSSILLDQDSLWIYIQTGEAIYISQNYIDNKTIIRKYNILDDGTKKFKSTFKTKLLDIDLHDVQKAGKRAQTILVFN